MKKLYTLISCLFSFAAIAQPTITQSDLPAAGLIFRSASNDNYIAPIPAGGANQTWNYTSLLNISTDTIAFSSASGTPYTSVFPGSNLTIYNAAQGSYEYLLSNSSGLYVSGFATATDTLIYNPKSLIIPVPFTYLNTANSTSRYAIVNPPYKLVVTTNNGFIADGWGTLMLPGAVTYTNTLRVKNTALEVDSFFIMTGTFDSLFTTDVSQSTTFLWVRHSGTDAFLLSIDADSAGITSESSSYKLSSTVGVNEMVSNSNSIALYPNPAKDVVHIKFHEPGGVTGRLEIYNNVGQVVKSYSLDDINQLSLYVTDLKNGLYHFVVHSNNKEAQSGTFIVSH